MAENRDDKDSKDDKSTSGVSISSKDGFDFHATSYWNSGNPEDKGSRVSADWIAKDGGWVKDRSTEHPTNQNYPKGSNKRH